MEYLTETFWLYRLPILVNGLLVLVVFLLAIEAGVRGAGAVSRINDRAAELARGDVTLTALLGLLGLILAFTYAFSFNRYDERRETAVTEANAIGTAFDRADLLPEPGRTELRRSLLEYARTRYFTAETVEDVRSLVRSLEASRRAQESIWPATKNAVGGEVSEPLKASVVSAINQVLDVYTRRMAAAFDQIPPVVLILLVLISGFSLAVTAYNATLLGNPSRWRLAAFAFILTALIVVIMDFDMQLRGLIRVSPISMAEVIEKMEAALPN